MTVTESNTKVEIAAEYERLRKEADKLGLDLPIEVATLNKNNTKGEYLSAVYEIDDIISSAGSGVAKQLSFATDESEMNYAESKKGNVKPETDKFKEAHMPKKPSSIENIKDINLDMLSDSIIDGLKSMRTVIYKYQKEADILNQLENELDTLAVSVNTQKERYIKQKEENEIYLEKLHSENEATLADIENSGQDKIAILEKRIEDKEDEIKSARLKKDALRKRESDDYDYAESIQYKKEDDLWEDEKNEREHAIKVMEEEVANLRDVLKQKELKVTELEKELSDLPKLLEEAENSAMKEREEELTAEQEHKTALFTKDSEAEIASLEGKLKSLTEDYEALLAEKESAQAKLDKAYEDSNKLYLQTVQSAGGIKILNGTD